MREVQNKWLHYLHTEYDCFVYVCACLYSCVAWVACVYVGQCNLDAESRMHQKDASNSKHISLARKLIRYANEASAPHRTWHIIGHIMWLMTSSHHRSHDVTRDVTQHVIYRPCILLAASADVLGGQTIKQSYSWEFSSAGAGAGDVIRRLKIEYARLQTNLHKILLSLSDSSLPLLGEFRWGDGWVKCLSLPAISQRANPIHDCTLLYLDLCYIIVHNVNITAMLMMAGKSCNRNMIENADIIFSF